MNPARTQRTRKSKPGIPVGSVYVGRPSQWGNPAMIGEWNNGTFVKNNFVAVAMFYEYLKTMAATDPESFVEYMTPLVDRDLCCWCNPNDPCHGDILLAIVRHVKTLLFDADFRTKIPASIVSWPEISCIVCL